MLYTLLSQALARAGQEGRLLYGVPMARYTTFRIGGPEEVFLDAADETEVITAVRLAREEGAQVTHIGNGSNLLVRDGGIRGLVVRIGPAMAQIETDGTCLRAQSGASLGALSHAAAEASLEGLEFASGIPGTVGGAAAMNAGAYGGEMAQVITRVRALDTQLQPKWVSAGALDFGYRHSAVLEHGWIITQVELSLRAGSREEILGRMRDLSQRRREKQPLSLPSAGSTFKRPEGYFAARLIDDAGLRGLRVGGAQVSEKHTGFIVNTGDATAADVLALMEEVKARVYALFGVKLEPEVRILGENA